MDQNFDRWNFSSYKIILESFLPLLMTPSCLVSLHLIFTKKSSYKDTIVQRVIAYLRSLNLDAEWLKWIKKENRYIKVLFSQ